MDRRQASKFFTAFEEDELSEAKKPGDGMDLDLSSSEKATLKKLAIGGVALAQIKTLTAIVKSGEMFDDWAETLTDEQEKCFWNKAAKLTGLSSSDDAIEYLSDIKEVMDGFDLSAAWFNKRLLAFLKQLKQEAQDL